MASLVLGVAGAAALGPAGLAWGGALGMSGAQIGFMVGSSLGSMLFQPNMPDIQGPRMADLKVQASTYGTPIPIGFGTTRGTGQVIWSSDIIETAHEEEAGGKGGLGGPSQEYTTYTYSVNCAIGVQEGEITGIRRIWANGDLIYDQSTGNLGPTGQSDNIRVYTGSETQLPDALIESYEGAGDVPAHRGLAYVVFENLQLEKYGNRIPNFSFEVVSDGAFSTPDYVYYSDQDTYYNYQMPHPYIDGLILAISGDNGGSQPATLHIIDMYSGTDRVIDVGTTPSSYCKNNMTHVLIVDEMGLVIINEIWVCYDTTTLSYDNLVAIALDPDTFAIKREIRSGDPGFDYIGNMHFDKASQKVLFATNSSTIFAGYASIDPITELWENGSSGTWYTGEGAAGDNSIALFSYYSTVDIFVSGDLVFSEPAGVSGGSITYDTLRRRYVWYNGDVSSKMTFKTLSDGDAFESQIFYPTTAQSGATFRSISYLKHADKYVACNQSSFYILNADTFEVEQTKTLLLSLAGGIKNAMEISQLPEYLALVVNDTAQGVALVPITDRLSSNGVTLSSIVTDICDRVGLAAGDIDVSQLTDTVEGYTIAQQMSARAALDGVQAAFFFDAVESD